MCVCACVCVCNPQIEYLACSHATEGLAILQELYHNLTAQLFPAPALTAHSLSKVFAAIFHSAAAPSPSPSSSPATVTMGSPQLPTTSEVTSASPVLFYAAIYERFLLPLEHSPRHTALEWVMALCGPRQ